SGSRCRFAPSCRARPLPERSCCGRGRAAAAATRNGFGTAMIRRLVSVSLHQPLVVLLLTALFVFAGIAAFRSLPIEAFPDVTDVQVTVITLFPGHAPEEVEKQVTMPLEIELSGLPHAVRLFSHTQFGLSFIIITFDDQVTDYFVRQ